ncbi:Integrase catalytic domain-containing protein [Abeliophyllum distichum]|uniref:Integrase catalytic domain-containing protein n=1 Tax=Abeliophyllum distichum TaxID=126358 RepID=A0ABD1RSD9_9LAMI
MTFSRVGVDMLHPELSAGRTDTDELNKGMVEDLVSLDPRSDLPVRQAGLVEELKTIEVDLNHPEKVLRIGKELNRSVRSELIAFLKSNTDVFAWEHADMEGIDPTVSCHKLNTSPDVRPRQQRRRPLNPERYEALANEVEKLLKCGFIRESLYPRWMANPVGKKSNGAWRVCIDFTDLNRACPKDIFPLSPNRPNGGCHSWARTPKLHGRLLRVQPNHNARK